MPAPLTRTTAAPLLAPTETVVLFDGVCKLCNGWARFLIQRDRSQRIRLASVQSPEGQALLNWAGLPTGHFDTMAVIRGHRYWVQSDAFLEVVALLPGAWKGLGLLRLCPAWIRDWLYDRIALNRYRLFGRHDACILPTPDTERRFLKAGH